MPVFGLYDYSFRPDHVSEADAVAWAEEDGVRAADERLLSPYPFATRGEWCEARIAEAEARLSAIPADTRIILSTTGRCGATTRCCRASRASRSGAARAPPSSGTAAIRSTPSSTGTCTCARRRDLDGVRFEEVSLGYPKQWNTARGVGHYLRKIR